MNIILRVGSWDSNPDHCIATYYHCNTSVNPADCVQKPKKNLNQVNSDVKGKMNNTTQAINSLLTQKIHSTVIEGLGLNKDTGFKRVSINYNKQNRRHLQQTHVQGLGHPAEQSHLLATLVLVGLGTAHFSSVTSVSVIFSGVGVIMVAELGPVIELRDGQRSLEPGQNRN